jgi:hypothetical protein
MISSQILLNSKTISGGADTIFWAQTKTATLHVKSLRRAIPRQASDGLGFDRGKCHEYSSRVCTRFLPPAFANVEIIEKA